VKTTTTHTRNPYRRAAKAKPRTNDKKPAEWTPATAIAVQMTGIKRKYTTGLWVWMVAAMPYRTSSRRSAATNDLKNNLTIGQPFPLAFATNQVPGFV
jgi:hypothetical protein